MISIKMYIKINDISFQSESELPQLETLQEAQLLLQKLMADFPALQSASIFINNEFKGSMGRLQ